MLVVPILIRGQHNTHINHWNNTSFPSKKALTYAISSNPRWLEFAKNQYHRFSIALFKHLFLFKLRVTGIIRKRIN